MRYNAAGQLFHIENVMHALSVCADMGGANGQVRISKRTRDIVKQAWPVPPGNLDDSRIG